MHIFETRGHNLEHEVIESDLVSIDKVAPLVEICRIAVFAGGDLAFWNFRISVTFALNFFQHIHRNLEKVSP